MVCPCRVPCRVDRECFDDIESYLDDGLAHESCDPVAGLHDCDDRGQARIHHVDRQTGRYQ